LTAVAGLLFAGAASAQIAGTGHDFSDGVGFDGTWNTTNDRTCNVCHTTHSGLMNITGVPLWDHATSTASFVVYSGVNMSEAPGTPSGVTLLCLSCHDGTVALDSFGAKRDTPTFGGTRAMQSGNSAYVGTDLNDDHPVSMAYNGTTAGLNATPTSALTPLFGGNVECASCHEVHNSAGQASLLVMDPVNSELCLSCHDK
jgi:predicted CXXCH cytochrome family protein